LGPPITSGDDLSVKRSTGKDQRVVVAGRTRGGRGKNGTVSSKGKKGKKKTTQRRQKLEVVRCWTVGGSEKSVRYRERVINGLGMNIDASRGET